MQDGHDKVKLDACQQIEHLKAKGVKFDRCSEREAAAYLKSKNFYFKLTAYRKLFDKYEGGRHDGEYIDLDFAQLIDLASIDQRLREALLPMTLDIEHFAKVRIMGIFESDRREDGYSIIADYLDSLPSTKRHYIDREFKIRSHDTYCGAIISKYRDDMPIWAFLEIVSFGTFIDFYRFCATRWSDMALMHDHYLLKYVKAIRNASAHGSCILNDLDENGAQTRPSPDLMRAIANMDIPKRLRGKKMGNIRLRQIAALFFFYDQLVPDGKASSRSRRDLETLFAHYHASEDMYPDNSSVESSMRFIERLTKGFNLSY